MRKILLILVILLVGCIRPPSPTGMMVLDSIEDEFVNDTVEFEEVVIISSPEIEIPQESKVIEPDSIQINLTRNGIEPRNITIAKGSVLRFVNYDRTVKQIISSDFSSPILRSLQSYEYTFDEVGTFGFHEKEHPEDWGRINVVEPFVNEYEMLVKITPYKYQPEKIEITVGDRVRWRNTDTTSHTVSGAGFDSQTLRSKEEFTHKFTRVGIFPYGDSYHGNLVGTVVVRSE